MTATTTAQLLHDMGAAWLLLYQDVYSDDTQTMQWTHGSTPAPREDTTERQTGLTADPVWSSFSDERRLALRTAVTKAEWTLGDALAKLTAARDRLQAALNAE